MVMPEVSLATLGYNSEERLTTEVNFGKQLETYALHVVEDRPVSNVYSYFIDKNRNKIYIDESQTTELFVDPEERDGYSLYGTLRAINFALDNPGKIVFLYSPPGPVAFGSGTKYDNVKDYPSGQLYIMVGRDDNRVDTIAISVGKENEKQTLDLFLGKQNNNQGFDDEKEKIKYYLSNPLISYLNIDDLYRHIFESSKGNNFLVYENIRNKKYWLSDIAEDLKKGWLNEIRPQIDFDYNFLFQLAENYGVSTAYLYQLRRYFPVYEIGGIMPLGGSCGGSEVNEYDLGGLSDPIKAIIEGDNSPLSTAYRLQTTLLKDSSKTDEYGSLEFHCPVCGGIHTREPHKQMKVCPVKGEPIPKCE